jgi:hypothetical protein
MVADCGILIVAGTDSSQDLPMQDEENLLATIWVTHQFFQVDTHLAYLALSIALLLAMYLVMLQLWGPSCEDHMVVSRLARAVDADLSE